MTYFKKIFLKLICFVICLAILISVPICALLNTTKAEADKELIVLTVWQIDSFEGGKGSRANYLKTVASELSKNSSCFINVISLNAEAAKTNLDAGTSPDIISYGAGICGIEGYIREYRTWCRGGYCILTVSENADFTDITNENTVINGGTDNYARIAAILNNLGGAAVDKPTGAYVKLINGEYKYLLGTQRDVYRLKTRGVNFSVKPIANFNDLYQNISIITNDKIRANYAEKFVGLLINKSHDLVKLGLMYDGAKLYDDEMSIMEGIDFTHKIAGPISRETKTSLDNSIMNCDENKLKNLLK